MFSVSVSPLGELHAVEVGQHGPGEGSGAGEQSLVGSKYVHLHRVLSLCNTSEPKHGNETSEVVETPSSLTFEPGNEEGGDVLVEVGEHLRSRPKDSCQALCCRPPHLPADVVIITILIVFPGSQRVKRTIHHNNLGNILAWLPEPNLGKIS